MQIRPRRDHNECNAVDDDRSDGIADSDAIMETDDIIGNNDQRYD
jgi:hypothetical protein